jgi:cytidylate kinase
MPKTIISVITISGPPGSGTTTAARLLAEQTGFPYRNTGSLFREMAAETGMSLNDFGAYALTHPDVDRELDRRQLDLARNGRVILEGRLSGHVVKKHGVPAVCVWLDAPLDVRVQRLSARDVQDLVVAADLNRRREELERQRYLEVYGYDLADLSVYDLVLDSSVLTPEGIVSAILSKTE